MSTQAKQRLLAAAEQLISEGAPLAQSSLVETQDFYRWWTGCRNLMRMLGSIAQPWEGTVGIPINNQQSRLMIQGTLESLKQAIDRDLLITVEQLVFAEAFDDLLDQAEYLFNEGYFIAAGVLGRAVLEEHLRKWCDRVPCIPSKPKPTLNDFRMELQKSAQLNKIESRQVEWLGDIGNDCAHNLGKSTQADVEKLLRDVGDFLAQHPLP